MAGTKRTKQSFFDGVNGPAGLQFRKGNRPPQTTFEDLTASTPFFTESDDRARLDDFTPDIKDKQGLTVLATDTQAKSNAAQEVDRSLVAQPSQLPTVVPGTNTGTGDPDSEDAVEVLIDGGVTTRNEYIVQLRQPWVDWLISQLNISSVIIDNSLYVMKNGNDGTGQRTFLSLPYETYLGASGAALPGDTVFIYPGTYDGAIPLLTQVSIQTEGRVVYSLTSDVEIITDGGADIDADIYGNGLFGSNGLAAVNPVVSITGANSDLNISCENIYSSGNNNYLIEQSGGMLYVDSYFLYGLSAGIINMTSNNTLSHIRCAVAEVSQSGGVDISGGSLVAEFGRFRNVSAGSWRMINVTGGVLRMITPSLTGGGLYINNGDCLLQGTNINVDTGGVGDITAPIEVEGGNLVLDNCNLVNTDGASLYSIAAIGGPQSVEIRGTVTANKIQHPDITFTGSGNFIFDPTLNQNV